MPRSHINGIDLYYESYGRGVPLVLAYGLGGNTRMWAGQIDAFAPHYRLILWDPRGHGQSDSPPPPRTVWYADLSARPAGASG